MRQISFIFIACLAYAGCTTSHLVTDSMAHDPRWVTQFNDHSQDCVVSIERVDGAVDEGNEVHVMIDSLSFVGSNSRERVIVPIDSIKKVTIFMTTYGTLEGIGIGILGGGATGLLAAWAQYPHPMDMQGLAYVLYPVIFGGAGAIAGGITGYTIDHKYVYLFTKEQY
jgi:MFS family permease